MLSTRLLLAAITLFIGMAHTPLCGYAAPTTPSATTPYLHPGFSYKVDETRERNQRLQQWSIKNPQQPLDDTAYRAVVWDAFNAATHRQPLTLWRFEGGPHPAVIQPQVVLTNPTEQAWLNLTVTLTVMAQWAPLRAKPPLWLLDVDALEQNTHWQPLAYKEFRIKVLAPDQSKTLLAPAFSLPDALASRRSNTLKNGTAPKGSLGEWPVTLGVIAHVRSSSGPPSAKDTRSRAETQLKLTPSYLVPDPPSIRMP
ncbi:MAG: hypothetical protein U0003_02595 [Vampirovibrionales bacterium]